MVDRCHSLSRQRKTIYTEKRPTQAQLHLLAWKGRDQLCCLRGFGTANGCREQRLPRYVPGAGARRI